ncbi:S8 family peptidase [Pollutimonas bauzanensis]|uniref:Subtilase family protein n=1 Tax=Pollutimonas bauzanensis TaxID=658167 RepID=A0A1M5ZM48_9BURK|nr:S8 family peptidase [Pollutimonas bauzanensis]SHI25208.1 Subtilase family protein [Pollutimonas bauzanensis]
MPDQPHDKRPHLILHNTAKPLAFTAHTPNGGAEKIVPDLPRQQHGKSLQNQLNALKPAAAAAAAAQQRQGLESGLGLQIQFVSQPDVELAFESLANRTKRIELLSVRKEGGDTFANVFVPDGQLAHFEKYVVEYLEEKKNKNGAAIDHRPLLNTIASIRAAELRALWTDDPDLLPEDPTTPFWWEVWLPVRGLGQRESVVADFKKVAELAGCVVNFAQANFPERTVLLMYGSEQQFSRSVMTLNCVAELRRAKDTAEFFDGMGVDEQRQWVDDMTARAQFVGAGDDVPRICLLDSGVNRGHPLLVPLLTELDLHTVEPEWGVDDRANHGTGLAGIAAYGDLTDALAAEGPLHVAHRLESVKLTPNDGANQGTAKHHAYLFAEAVSRPEIAAPHRHRVFTSAVTASDYRDRGRPSSWSSAVDGLAADADGAGLFPRLFILSAGNTNQHDAWMAYPASLSTNLVHDPGQAWNAITVGACTNKTNTENADAEAIAADGGLSPYTSTSRTWDGAWPLKPDVVLEGGNVSRDAQGAAGMPSLNLLTAHHRPNERLLTTTNATSAASALCARMAAQLMATYAGLRPETIRGLIVHSAEWSDTMRGMYLPADRASNKTDYVDLIRHCGWGSPDLERALWSAGNSLTLVVEDMVHPYVKDKKKGVVSRDMNLHALPWPKEQLEALQNAKVQMRVTLSYFIEPNPSARGVASKFHYPSHRLRFDVQRPLDATTDDFVARVNAAAEREDEGDPVNPKDPNWYLGDRQRHRGSLHQDIWEGTAAELASRGYIAVYPSAGWWRTRPALERYDLPARYSLIVSIRTAQMEVDLYNAIAQQIVIEV